MESKGYALAFVLILAIICTGAYVAVSALRANNSRPLVQIERPTEATDSPVTLAVATATPVQPTATPLPPTVTPQPPITLPIQTATPTTEGKPVRRIATATATVALPTPTAVPRYAFVQDGPVRGDFSHNCTAGAYILGYVRDAKGTLLEGVQIQATDAWGNNLKALSKGGTDLGKYDIPINSNVADTWNVTITDNRGTPQSLTVAVQHSGQFVPDQQPCWHRLDWKRTY
ncbi:MAG: hypothetical protein GXP41_12765 [Chloroflexi bacterium]|nr:hypothetical protein [Chloroflexota bacterium]